MTTAVVDIFDPITGEPVKYRRVSARIKEFNKRYSPENGYRIESEMRDSLSLQPGRLALLREAIANGKAPAEVGLNDLDNGLVMVCTHRLLDKEGNVLRDASAAKHVQGNKDYEVLETASLQRLMAKLGHGGEIFDDDEDRDIEDQGLPHREESGTVTPIKADPVSNTDTSIETETAKPPLASADPVAPEPEPAKGDEAADGVPPAMVRQMANLAARLDEEPPHVTTFTEAKLALKDLNERLRISRSSDTS